MVSPLLDPLADDPKDHLIMHPKAVRLILYRRPTSISMDEEMYRQGNFKDTPFNMTLESSVNKQDNTIEEWSWILSDQQGGDIDMNRLTTFMVHVFDTMSSYSPQIELLDHIPHH
jgi:uncharacterized coiled-coil protein SlyX